MRVHFTEAPRFKQPLPTEPVGIDRPLGRPLIENSQEIPEPYVEVTLRVYGPYKIPGHHLENPKKYIEGRVTQRIRQALND